MSQICSSEAVVLKTLRFQETGLIASLYTRDFGRVSVLAKGMLSPRASRKWSVLSPTDITEVIYRNKAGRELQTLTDAGTGYWAMQLKADPVRRLYALLIVEIFEKSVKEHEANTDLYDFLRFTLVSLDRLPHGYFGLLVYFLVHLTRFLGFFPLIPKEAEPDRVHFHLKDNRFLPVSAPPEPCDSYLFRYCNSDFTRAVELEVPKHLRKSLVERLLAYYELHVEHFSTVNTLRIFESIFAPV
jgi:DNA repair protein RecO (recombination protein O)